jgi:hypothetical protein
MISVILRRESGACPEKVLTMSNDHQSLIIYCSIPPAEGRGDAVSELHV